MARDPRLASPHLLALAALRVQQRAATQPGEAVVLQIVYEAYGDEPPLLGERHVLVLPQHAPSVEAWTQATARFRESPRTRPGHDTQQGSGAP